MGFIFLGQKAIVGGMVAHIYGSTKHTEVLNPLLLILTLNCFMACLMYIVRIVMIGPKALYNTKYIERC